MRKPVPGFENLYEVDSAGEIWRIGAPRARPLKPVRVGNYFRVVLSKNNVKRPFLVHQVVLLTFEGPCPVGMETRHLDGDTSHNAIGNLCYGTRQENADDRQRHGTVPRGEKHHRALLTETQVHEIRAATKGIRRLGGKYGVSISTIEAIRARRIWAHL